jgi:hypothetical protein
MMALAMLPPPMKAMVVGAAEKVVVAAVVVAVESADMAIAEQKHRSWLW